MGKRPALGQHLRWYALNFTLKTLDMRYTLSVLTAVCLLALGQPAWSEASDREVVRRAHRAVMALPDDTRASANQLLQQLQAQQTPAPSQRSLRWHPMFQAAAQALVRHYSSTIQSHTLAHALLSVQHYVPKMTPPSGNMQLDLEMVHRWLAPWLAETTA